MLSTSKIKDKLFYGWVVAIAGLVIGTLIFGTRFSFGVFFKSLEGEFELTRTVTSSIFSVYMLLCPLFAILGGWALDRYGPRSVTFFMGLFSGLSLLLTSQVNSSWQLFITYSLLLAIGTGATYTVVMSTISRWFDRKRGLALGIGSSGGGLGTVVMAPLAAYLIASFDWRIAYIVMGLITGLVVILLSMLLRKDPSEMGLSPDGVRATSDKIVMSDKKDEARLVSFSLIQAFRTRSFWALSGVWLSFSFCLHLLITHFVPHATDLGVSAAEAAIILGLTGSISIPGRLMMGWVSDKIGRKVSAIACALLQSGAMVWLAWAQDLWMLYLFAVVYGFAYGGFDSPVTALVGDIFGLRSLGIIIGVLGTGWGIGAAIGPVLGGLVFDVTQTYFLAFLIGALAMLIAVLCLAFVRWETNRQRID